MRECSKQAKVVSTQLVARCMHLLRDVDSQMAARALFYTAVSTRQTRDWPATHIVFHNNSVYFMFEA